MCEKSCRTVRSKIPRFQGSRISSAKAESVNPRKDHHKQSGNVTVKSSSLINYSDIDKREQLDNDRDTPFEPDPQALDSILSNKGISVGAIRASEMTSLVPLNRLSMWDSLNEFKQNLRQYKESFQQVNAISDVKTDLKPETPTGNCKSAAPLTPKSSRTLTRTTQMSMMESYEQHKENVKIFREKMQIIDSALQTPNPPGNNVYGEFTPKQRQRGLTNKMRNTLSATPVNNHVRRAWTELKENRPPPERMKKLGTLSTFKINPSKLCAIDETSPAGKQDVWRACGRKPVRRALLLSSGGNEATEKLASVNSCVKTSKEYCIIAANEQPVTVSSSVKEHLVQYSLYSNCGSESSIEMPTISGLVFKSPDVIQVSQIIPVFLTPKSPFPSGTRSAVSSTDCTWSCQQTVCTPRPKTSERAHEATDNSQRIQNTQTVSKSTADSLKLLYYNTQAVASMESTPAFLHTYRTSEVAKTALQLPLSAASELNGCFNKLLLNSSPAPCTAASLQSGVIVPNSWRGSTPTVLKTPVLSTPVRTFHGETFMADSSSLSTNCPTLTVTPLSQVSRVLVRDQSSPAASSYFSLQPSRQNEGMASCLKNRGLTKLDNTDGLSLRCAVSSVKKLRWADNQGCVKD